jgi:hypothetical protein
MTLMMMATMMGRKHSITVISLVCLRFCVTDLWPIVKRKGCAEFSEVVTFVCFGGEDWVGGRGTRNATCGRTALLSCLAGDIHWLRRPAFVELGVE